MNAECPILSAVVPPAHIEGSRVVEGEPAALPSRSLGLGPFSVGRHASGLPRLEDSAGNGWGIFANETLARQTAARLSQ